MESIQAYIEGVKGLIFDYGGTIDSGGEHWSHVIWRAWQAEGVKADYPTFREAYVYAERELARTLHISPHHNFSDLLQIKMNIELQWLSQHGEFPPENIADKAAKIAVRCYDAARAQVEKSAETLAILSERYPMVLVSNFYGNIETVLEDFGIRKYFKEIVESARVGVRKPDPEIFRLGVKALKMKPEETLVVGDSYRKDIVPALKAGCRAIWIKGAGWTAEEDTVEYPYTIVDLSELVKKS